MNPLNLFRKSRGATGVPQAHMTFARSSAARTIMRTGTILKKQAWLWPIIAVVVLAIVGVGVSSAIRTTMKASFQSQLQTLLNVETAMLETWLKTQGAGAETQANNRSIRDTIEKLIATQDEKALHGSDATTPAVPVSAAQFSAQLGKELGVGMVSHDFVGFFVTDRKQKILASSETELVGRVIGEYESFLARAIEGTTSFSTPMPSIVLMKDDRGRMRTGQPTMFVAAPVRDTGFQVIGALAMQIKPEREFTRILQLGRIGASGVAKHDVLDVMTGAGPQRTEGSYSSSYAFYPVEAIDPSDGLPRDGVHTWSAPGGTGTHSLPADFLPGTLVERDGARVLALVGPKAPGLRFARVIPAVRTFEALAARISDLTKLPDDQARRWLAIRG